VFTPYEFIYDNRYYGAEFGRLHPAMATPAYSRAWSTAPIVGTSCIFPQGKSLTRGELGTRVPTVVRSTARTSSICRSAGGVPAITSSKSLWRALCWRNCGRYFIIDAAVCDVGYPSSSTQAYTDEVHRSLLVARGFGGITFYPAIGRSPDVYQDGLLVILSQKLA
jgi:hypothetical protein